MSQLSKKLLTTSAPMSSYERWSLIVSIVSLLVSILGFGAVWISLNGANESLRTSIYGNLSNWTFELDKAFLEHPELRPYFYNGKDIDSEDPLYPAVESMAEYMLDTFDSVLEHQAYFPDGTPHEGWMNWVEDSFDHSPMLRKYLEENKRWYNKGPVWPIYERWRAANPQPEL